MFANPLGLLALLALPAVLALHLFRRRFRPRTVSAVFLWADRDRSALSGRTRERLRSSPSLWLELAAALALALALAGPRGCGAGSAEHLVVVLDTSASMSATTGAAGGGARASAATRARAEVVRRIEALSARSRVTLVQSGSRPRVLAGPAAFPAEAVAALDAYDPGAARHDLAPAVALALELAGGRAVALVTDAFEPEAWPPNVEVVALGVPAENLGIVHAARSRELEEGAAVQRVYVTVESFAASPATTQLSLSSEGAPLTRSAVALEPGERRTFAFRLPDGTGIVQAALESDALAADDRAWLAPQSPRTLRLFVDLEPDTARALGLASDAQGAALADRWADWIDDATAAEEAATSHLAIARAALGGPRTWCLTLESPGTEREDLIGPFLVEKRHPLLEGVTLEGVVWSRDPGVALRGAPLVSGGDTPLIVETREGERRTFRAALDPRRSTLARSPDWPILLANLAELRRAELPGLARANVRLGETVLYRPGAQEVGGAWSLAPPGGGPTREVRSGLARSGGAGGASVASASLLLENLEPAGVWTLLRDGREASRFVVNFCDAAESDLRDLAFGRREAQVAAGEAATSTSPLQWALIAVVLVCALADAWVLGAAPRATAAPSGAAA